MGHIRNDRALVALVITSVGSPAAAVPALHGIGCLVLADVATLTHARKVIADLGPSIERPKER